MDNISLTFRGIDLDIEFNYSPEEPMVMYYADGSGYPGCSAEAEIIKITYDGKDLTDMFDNLGLLEEIEIAILENFNN